MNSLTEITKSAKCLIIRLQKKWATRLVSLYQVRHIPVSYTHLAGAFTLGSSIELSADAPLREPYAVWMQGSLNFHSGKLAVMLAASKILRDEK